MSPSRTTTPEAAAARQAGLRYVSDELPGIARRKAGKGFAYRDADGAAIRDAAVAEAREQLGDRLGSLGELFGG